MPPQGKACIYIYIYMYREREICVYMCYAMYMAALCFPQALRIADAA